MLASDKINDDGDRTCFCCFVVFVTCVYAGKFNWLERFFTGSQTRTRGLVLHVNALIHGNIFLWFVSW